jgi:hypothetical protein
MAPFKIVAVSQNVRNCAFVLLYTKIYPLQCDHYISSGVYSPSGERSCHEIVQLVHILWDLQRIVCCFNRIHARTEDIIMSQI